MMHPAERQARDLEDDLEKLWGNGPEDPDCNVRKDCQDTPATWHVHKSCGDDEGIMFSCDRCKALAEADFANEAVPARCFMCQRIVTLVWTPL